MDEADMLRQFWTSKVPIIITSRNRDATSQLATQSIEVTSFSDDVGSAFLFQLLGRDVSTGTEHPGAALAISKAIGGLPLALTQVASLMKRRNLTFKDFLTISGKHQARLWKQPTTERTSYHHTMDTVFSIAFARLSAQAIDLLRLMSVLDPDTITIKLLHVATAGLTADGDNSE
jgi:hypothetical protein